MAVSSYRRRSHTLVFLDGGSEHGSNYGAMLWSRCASGNVCPGNHESAGKRQRGTKRLGNVHVTTALVEAAQGAIRKKGSYYGDKFHRLKARRGYKRALMAIAHKILTAIYNMLRTASDFRELGAAYLDRAQPKRVAKSLVKRLESLGFDVQISERAA